MAMGLAQHRIGNPRAAAAAFDSGFVVLGDSIRRFLDRFERVLDSASRVTYTTYSASARTRLETVYWRNTDPIWSVEGTEPRTEFLARVTFAQLRWGADELTLDGVTSDFGNVYVRTGKWQGGRFWRPPGAPEDLRENICVPQAASRITSMIEAEVTSDGLTTTVLPAARAGATAIMVRKTGEFHGVMTATTPRDSRSV